MQIILRRSRFSASGNRAIGTPEPDAGYQAFGLMGDGSSLFLHPPDESLEVRKDPLAPSEGSDPGEVQGIPLLGQDPERVLDVLRAPELELHDDRVFGSRHGELD